ncbi:MAG: hypothetical protein H7Y30_14895 [Pyrinomonadaceae bacterium]|nr:hypothetical protein [Pyrinomonadaceae bacterium]
MKKLSQNRAPVFAIACALLVVGGAAVFAKTKAARLFTARPEVKVSLAGFVSRGQAQVSVEKAEAVSAGEIVNWNIHSDNVGNGAAHDYKVVGQIPKGTVLVAGSQKAEGRVRVTYSIDGGKSFVPTPTIAEKQADGTMKQVDAPVSMYTQVRYEWADPLAASGKLNASYQVRVK